MPGLSDLLCGCASMARATSTTIETPIKRHASSSSSTLGTAGRAGLVQACNYEADSEDALDVELSLQLATLDRSLASSLLIRRLALGEYELDGRRVRVNWARPPVGAGPRLLMVLEATGDGSEGEGVGTEMPFSDYLKQVADVAASLGGRSAGAPLVARVPVKERLTFTANPQQPIDDMGMERLRSMRMACEQARLREHAAEEYDRRERERSASLGRHLSSDTLGGGGGFGAQMRSTSVTSLGSRGRAPTPDSRAGGMPMSRCSSGYVPLAGMLASTSIHVPLGAPAAPGNLSARALSPPIASSYARGQTPPPPPQGSFFRGPSPPTPLPRRSSSASVLPPSSFRTPSAGPMPPLPVPVQVMDKQWTR